MKLKAFIVALAFGFFGCNEAETPLSDTSQVSLSFNTVNSSSGGNYNERVLANGFSFSSGFITISEIEFEAKTESGSISAEFEHVVKIDFTTGASTPDIITSLGIPAGTYNEVEVEIELHEYDDHPAVVLNGAYVDAEGTAHEVRFELNSDEEFEVKREGLITFGSGESIMAQVTIYPQAWFSEVSHEDLLKATKNMEGVIVISETENEDIFDLIEDGLDLAAELKILN